MEPETLCFNGINGSTGEYLLSPQPPEVISAVARGEEIDPEHLAFLKRWWEHRSASPISPHLRCQPRGPGIGRLGRHLRPEVTTDSDVYRALTPLLEHRRAQASREKSHYYKEYLGPQQAP